MPTSFIWYSWLCNIWGWHLHFFYHFATFIYRTMKARGGMKHARHFIRFSTTFIRLTLRDIHTYASAYTNPEQKLHNIQILYIKSIESERIVQLCSGLHSGLIGPNRCTIMYNITTHIYPLWQRHRLVPFNSRYTFISPIVIAILQIET